MEFWPKKNFWKKLTMKKKKSGVFFFPKNEKIFFRKFTFGKNFLEKRKIKKGFFFF